MLLTYLPLCVIEIHIRHFLLDLASMGHDLLQLLVLDLQLEAQLDCLSLETFNALKIAPFM